MKYFFIILLGIVIVTDSCKQSQSSLSTQVDIPKKKSAEWYLEQGINESKNTNSYLALDNLSKAISKKFHYEQAYMERAKVYASIDSTERAVADYDTLISWNKNNQDKRGNLYLLIGNTYYAGAQDSLSCLYYRMSRDMNNSASWDKIRKYCK